MALNPLNSSNLEQLALKALKPEQNIQTYFYSAPVGERSIVISLSVCLFMSVCKHISGTAGPIVIKFCVQIPCGLGSVLLRQHCNTLCTSGFIDDATFGHNGP